MTASLAPNPASSDQTTPLRLAVLLSGSGTTLENLFVKIAQGSLNAQVVVVVGSRPDAFGLERARQRGVSALVVERKKIKPVEEFSKAVFDALAPFKPDLIVMAGFNCLALIPPEYQGRVVNVHPALLPSFGGKGYYGLKVHQAVLDFGCKVSGCTVHWVDNEYDHGKIIAQKAVDVLPSDTAETLAARVQAAERELYPNAIQGLCGTLRRIY